MHKRIIHSIIPIQTTVRADPKPVAAITKKCIDIIIGEAARLPGDILIDAKGMAVIAVEAIAGGQPDETLAVLDDRQYRSLGEAILDIQVVKDQALGISV